MELFNDTYEFPKKIKMYVGIDPGVNGGIAYKYEGTVKAVYMPKTRSQLNEYVKTLKDINDQILAGIEEVAMRPSDIKEPYMFMRLQKMVRNVEMIKSALVFNNVAYIPVHPRSWQAYLKLSAKSYEQRKELFKLHAIKLFPELKVTKKNADALLILKYMEMRIFYEPEKIKEMFKKEHESF